MAEKDDAARAGCRMVLILMILAGTAFLLLSPSSAAVLGTPADDKAAVTITAGGSQSYYLGEKVILSGRNTASDSTFLFITGPNMPDHGGKITSPRTAVISGNPDTFTEVKTKTDAAWEYSFYTANLPYDAGSYTLYAASSPVTADTLGNSTTYGTVSIILKKPFINATISPSPVMKGKTFTVTGSAEGQPPEVKIWIIGNNYFSTTQVPVNTDASFTFTSPGAIVQSLEPGQYWLFVQHPMQNNQFDINTSGDYVRNEKQNGTILFKVSGAGSLQGPDAADALVAAFGDPEMLNEDTYTVIPFQVTGPGNTTAVSAAVTTIPSQQATPHASLQYALIGTGFLVFAWGKLRKRQ